VIPGCWADPLSRKERIQLARKLARACKDSYSARLDCQDDGERMIDHMATSADMSDLHMDVTERAEVAAS
jgi:hypothetical protein